MLKCFLYALYNTVALLIILFVLFYMNTFINGTLIHAFLKKNFGTEMVVRFLIAALEGVVLILFVRQLNKRYFLQAKSGNVVTWTAIIEIVFHLSLCNYVLSDLPT
jgi:hypothetical protein